MKNIKRLLFLVITLCCVTSVAHAKYSTVAINDASQIPSNISSTYVAGELKDEIGYFTGSRAGWGPRLKYETNSSASVDGTYLFCLTYHTLAPNSKVSYTSVNYDSTTNMNAIRYIIENGFNRNYTNMDDLKYDYYITQLAIWQYLGSNGFDISGVTPKDNWQTQAKNAIMTLANNAKSATLDSKKIVAKYRPSNSSYQELVPAIIYTLPEEKAETPVMPVIKYPVKIEDESEVENTVRILYKDFCTGDYVTGAKMKLYNEDNELVESWTSDGSSHVVSGLKAGTYTLKDKTNNYSLTMNVVDTTKTQVFTFNTKPEVCTIEEEVVKEEIIKEENNNDETVEEIEVIESTEETIEEIEPEYSGLINPDTGIVGGASILTLLGGALGTYKYSSKKNLFNKKIKF